MTVPTIAPVTATNTPAASEPTLAAVKAKFGGVPKMFATFAHSPAALEAVAGYFNAMGGAKLSPRTQEAIAIAVAELNRCTYCLSAHTALAKGHGVKADELVGFRSGRSPDAKEQAILDLAVAIARTRAADVGPQLAQARKAGLSDAELVEVVAAVAQNVLTNYLNVVAGTEVDFPRVS
ncbi:carboxymuconolactone decarboxylase family protein [Pyxidicoccus sp. 3LG]